MDASLAQDFSLLSPFDPSDFPDARLHRRARKCLHASAQGHLTSASLSEALRRGKHRFCHNTNLPAESLLQASGRGLPQHWLQAPVVLSAEDTMFVRPSGSLLPLDVGPLRHAYDRGYVVHDSFGLLPGASFPEHWLGALVWTRGWDLHLKDHKQRSPEERESFKWSLLRTQIHQRLRAAGFGGRIVSLNDREGDNWTSLWLALALGHEVISRATQDRCLEHGEGYLKAFLRSQPAVARMRMPLYGAGKQRHQPRWIEVELRWSEVTLTPPTSAPAEQSEPLTLTGLHLRQVGRAGRKRFESFLLTTCPVRTDEEALEIVGWYGHRWASEVGHDVLKNGLNLEKFPVRDVKAFQRLLALEGPVAAQVAQWVHAARQPQPPAVTKVFRRETLQGLRQACRFYKEKAPPRWTVATVVETLARLGGADVRPNRPPGWRAVLRGWRKFEEFEQIRTFAQTGQVPDRQAQARPEAEEDEEDFDPEPIVLLWKRKP